MGLRSRSPSLTNWCVRRLLAGISAARIQQLHAAVADAIESLYPRFVNERAGEITDHLLKAGPFADRQETGPLVDAGRQERT